jgi:hypothetical protein
MRRAPIAALLRYRAGTRLNTRCSNLTLFLFSARASYIPAGVTNSFKSTTGTGIFWTIHLISLAHVFLRIHTAAVSC